MKKTVTPLENEEISNEFIKTLLEITQTCFHTDADGVTGSDNVTLFYKSGLMATLELLNNTMTIYPQEDEYCDNINEKRMGRDLNKLMEAIKSIDQGLNIIVKH